MTAQLMDEVSSPPRPVTSLAALTKYEARRYVSSPFFSAGIALTVLTSYLFLHHTVTDPDGLPGYPATFLGVFGVVIGFRLSQSLNNSAEALDVAPTALFVRTAAMCLTAVVPFALGLLSLAALLTFQHTAGGWTYGTFSTSDRIAMLAGQVAVSALGGPLLGIAVARWVRSWVVLPVLVIFLNVWVMVTNGLASSFQNSFPVLMLRMFTPYTYFVTLDSAPRGVETWRGSPWAFLGWQLCLCVLAVTAALLRDAPPNARRRLLQGLMVLVPLTVAMYLLAVTGGLGHAALSHPDGTLVRL